MKPQFNAQFSTEFGKDARTTFDDIDRFLENQFLSIQQYHTQNKKFLQI